MKSVNQTEQSGDHIQLSKRYSQRENSTPDVINATDSASVSLNKSSKSLHYPMIDLLRGFAALSVIVYHVIEHINWKNFPLSGFAGDWFRIGWMSVDLFFVISGFVIVLSSIKSYEKSESNWYFQKNYLRRRITRIVPLHYLTCGIYLFFIAPEMITLPRLNFHLFTHAFFLHNWHPATHGSINGPNWSLGVEMQFYLLVMLAAGWLAKVRPAKDTGPRRFETGTPDLRKVISETYFADFKTRAELLSFIVGEGGLEPPASWSQTRHATNCATPRTG